MVDTTAETAQAESEGPEGSDKPPHPDIASNNKSLSPTSTPPINGTKSARKPSVSKPAPTATDSAARPLTDSPSHIPLPPPEFHAYPKAPGCTRKDLQQLEQLTDNMSLNGVPHTKQESSSSTTGSITPPTSESPSGSECDAWSLPSTQPPSRAASFSTGKSGGKVVVHEKVEPMTPTAPVVTPKAATKPQKESSKTPTAPTVSKTISKDSTSGRPRSSSRPGSRPPSVHSDGGQKFTLKDLLGAQKLVRRSSARSTSSKKSDSDRGGKSVAGESTTASLLKKYGVCEKVAIGKGATSVVRLAHKWDRSEEKLYAVKVRRRAVASVVSCIAHA